MKKHIIFILLFSLIHSCNIQKVNTNKNLDYSEAIPYILPGEVQKLLYEKVKEIKYPIYFLFDKIDSYKYKISINQYDQTFKGIKWIENSNRYVYLKGKFYPLIFEYDQLFSTPKTAKEFLDSVDPDDGSYTYSSIYSINEYNYYVEFNSKGEILYEGYDSIIKEK